MCKECTLGGWCVCVCVRCVFVCVGHRERTCCTMVVSSKHSWTMLFFRREYSVTLANGDLQQSGEHLETV